MFSNYFLCMTTCVLGTFVQDCSADLATSTALAGLILAFAGAEKIQNEVPPNTFNNKSEFSLFQLLMVIQNTE